MNLGRNIAIAIVTLTGLAIFVVAISRVLDRQQAHVDVERDRYPIVGVDLSAHNGHVDFKKVAADGVKFVFLKATEGTTFTDSKFIDNYHNARRAGLKVGAYHFFRFDCDGYEQGRNFLSTVDSLELDLPLAIDIEEWGNPEGYKNAEIITALRGMIFALEGSRHKVIIYTNKNGYGRFVRDYFDDMPVWVCSFTNPPIGGDRWILWQHSHQSQVDGISGLVDMNTFNGDSCQWEQWLSSF